MPSSVSQLLCVASEVLTSGVLVHLSIRDLQAVNVAFTSTPTHRAQIKGLWKSYPYECSDDVSVGVDDLKWLKSVDIKPVGIILSRNELQGINFVISNFPTVRMLECNHEDSLDDLLVHSLTDACPLLQVMPVLGRRVSDQGCLHLGSNLHTINMRRCTLLTDVGIASICSQCPHLKLIALDICKRLTDASLVAIANSYPHLQSISMQWNENFTDDGLVSIASKCHRLRSVKIRFTSISSRGLTALWAANSNLMDVNINSKNCTSDDDITQLVQCCSLLQHLSFAGCTLITDAALIAVAEHCPQLVSLDIYNCIETTDASLISLGENCHELKSIDVSGLENISDVGIAALVAGCPLLQDFYANYTNITDAGVIALIHGCRDLHKLTMTGCKFVSSAKVSAIAENCPQICVVL